MKKNCFTIFSGGTGGHVIPAIIFGNYLIENGYQCTLFLDKRGLYYAKNFKGKVIKINSAHFSGNLLFKIRSTIILSYGFIQAFFYLIKIRPRNCIAFGGYATFTPLTIASFFKIFGITEIYLHEQNSIIGKVNSIFLFFAKNIFINSTLLEEYKSKYSNKIVEVGLPNKIFKNVFKRKIEKNYKKKIKLFVYGGSQGSVNLNDGFITILKKLPSSYYKKISLLIQCSEKQLSRIQRELFDLNIEFETKDFFQDIEKILCLSDIVIARSGAGTINDIILFQVPSILVPLPHSLDNHQYFNAKYLSDKKAAKLIEEKDLKIDKSKKIFQDLLDDFTIRKNLINNLQLLKLPDTNKLMLSKIIK
tara:strand:+ start:1171 stop:2256 length:1086 start_codon:yes stop_codon:yes gene_type:complete